MDGESVVTASVSPLLYTKKKNFLVVIVVIFFESGGSEGPSQVKMLLTPERGEGGVSFLEWRDACFLSKVLSTAEAYLMCNLFVISLVLCLFHLPSAFFIPTPSGWFDCIAPIVFFLCFARYHSHVNNGNKAAAKRREAPQGAHQRPQRRVWLVSRPRRLLCPLQRVTVPAATRAAPPICRSRSSRASSCRRGGGLRAFWRGNLTSVLQRFPYSGIQLMFYDRLKHAIQDFFAVRRQCA